MFDDCFGSLAEVDRTLTTSALTSRTDQQGTSRAAQGLVGRENVAFEWAADVATAPDYQHTVGSSRLASSRSSPIAPSSPDRCLSKAL